MSFPQIITHPLLRGLFLTFVSRQLSRAPSDVRKRVRRSKVVRELFLVGAVVAFNQSITAKR